MTAEVSRYEPRMTARRSTGTSDMIGRRGSAVTEDLAAEDEFVLGPPACATCGTPLSGDPDEDPTGDAGLPICGECERANHFEVLDAMDGELDDHLS